MNEDGVMLYAARASRVENQDAIDACIVGMLADPKEVWYSALLCSWLLLLNFFRCILFLMLHLWLSRQGQE